MSDHRTEPYFTEWMNRVSAERIHLKSDFCQLLAERDAENERLRAMLENVQSARIVEEAKLERAEAVVEAADMPVKMRLEKGNIVGILIDFDEWEGLQAALSAYDKGR